MPQRNGQTFSGLTGRTSGLPPQKVTGAKRHSLGIKGRRRDAGAFENDRLNVIKQGGRKIISDGGSPSRTQRLTRAKIEILLLAQIGRHAGNDLGYTSLREFNGIHRRSAYTQLSQTVLLEVAMVNGMRDRACRIQRDAKLTSESCRSSRSNRDFILRSRTKDRTPIFP